MARPQKQTANYFPHYANKKSKTLFILENKFGNDGYAFYFKLLEMLCESDGHYLDCRDISTWEFLLAQTRVSEVKANEILEKLCELGKIDKDLWINIIIWYKSLVDAI